MYFTQQDLKILREHSGSQNLVRIDLINKLGQEFSIYGHIPNAYSKMQDVILPNLSVQPDYLMLRFGQEIHSNLMIKSPMALHSLNIDKIYDINGNILYENEDYFLQKLDILADIEDRYGYEDYFTTLHPYKDVVDALLGQTVIYVGNDLPQFKGQKAMVTFVGRKKDFKHSVRIKLEAGQFKPSIDVPVSEINKHLNIVDNFNFEQNTIEI